MAAGLAAPSGARAQAPAKPHRIDVHHHFAPPAWLAEVRGREMLQRANTEWTPAHSIHYDTAGAANAGALVSLLKLVTVAQVLFGTDFPPGGNSVDVAKSLATVGFSEADPRAIDRDNALKLLPRLG